MSKNIAFKIDDELHTQLKLLCVKNKISIKDYIIKLIEESLLINGEQNEKNSNSK